MRLMGTEAYEMEVEKVEPQILGVGANAEDKDAVILCPLCGNTITKHRMKDCGLHKNDLSILASYFEGRTAMDLLRVGEVAIKYLDPQRLGAEMQVRTALESAQREYVELMEKQRENIEKLAAENEKERRRLLEEQLEEQKGNIEEHQKEVERLQEEAAKFEQDRKVELERIQETLKRIGERLVGPGLGKTGELLTVKDLQSAFKDDDISDFHADRKGADIVAVVKSQGAEVGRVVVSVKHEVKWKSEFFQQIRGNMREQRCKWGVLVSRVFPSNALNENMYLAEERTMIVKPEYAVLAYSAMREAAKEWHDAQAWVRDQESKLEVESEIVKAVKEWVRGEKLQDTLKKLAEGKRLSESTEKFLLDFQGSSGR